MSGMLIDLLKIEIGSWGDFYKILQLCNYFSIKIKTKNLDQSLE